MPLGLADGLVSRAAARVVEALSAPSLLRRPHVTSIAFDKQPIVGLQGRLRWRTKHAGAAFLHVEQQGGTVLCDTQVPINGDITILVSTPKPIHVSLALRPKRLRANTEPVIYRLPPAPPVIPRPEFSRLEIPNKALLNDEFSIAWEVQDASVVDLIISNGDQNVIQEAVHPSGMRTIRATRAGKWSVRLTAQGVHAAQTETRFISVTVPPPRIDIECRVIAGPPGMRGTFTWCVTNAVRAFLQAPSRDQRSEAPLEGGFVAEVGQEPEHFFLVAIGIDGQRTSVKLRTEPYNLLNLSPAEE